MELFKLSAKLELDAREYEKGIRDSGAQFARVAEEMRARATTMSQSAQAGFMGIAAGLETVTANAYAAATAVAQFLHAAQGAGLQAAGTSAWSADSLGAGIGKLSGSAGSHAAGLDYVPYNDYRARLHAGEAVLTRAEAEDWRAGNATGGGIDYDAMAAALSLAVRDALSGVGVYMGAERVGDLVTERVSRNIARGAQTGRVAIV